MQLELHTHMGILAYRSSPLLHAPTLLLSARSQRAEPSAPKQLLLTCRSCPLLRWPRCPRPSAATPQVPGTRPTCCSGHTQLANRADLQTVRHVIVHYIIDTHRTRGLASFTQLEPGNSGCDHPHLKQLHQTPPGHADVSSSFGA